MAYRAAKRAETSRQAAGYKFDHPQLRFFQGMSAAKAGFSNEGTASTIDGARVAGREENFIQNIVARGMKVVTHGNPDGTPAEGLMNIHGQVVEKVGGRHSELGRDVIAEINAHNAAQEEAMLEYVSLWTMPNDVYCILTRFPAKIFAEINSKDWKGPVRGSHSERFFVPGAIDRWDEALNGVNTSPSFLQIASRKSQSRAFEKVRWICMNLLPLWRPVMYGGAVADRSVEGPSIDKTDDAAAEREAGAYHDSAEADRRAARAAR